MLDGERTALIDLDSFAGADPLLDTAGVLVRLGGMSLLFPAFDEERGRDYERAFADEYFGRVPRRGATGSLSTTPAPPSRWPSDSSAARRPGGRRRSKAS